MSKKTENVPDEDPLKLQIMIIGESAVGKTSLLLRYTEDKFLENHIASIGVDFKVKYIDIDSKRIKLQIWDTAGQEKFYAITKAYYAKAQGIFVVFDISKVDTFDKTQKWIDSIHKAANENISIVLVGNKCDMERKVSREKAEEFANQNNIKYFETSAKDGTNINHAFTELAKMAFRNNPQILEPQIQLNTEESKCSC